MHCLNVLLVLLLCVLRQTLQEFITAKTHVSPLSKCKHIQYSRVMIFVFCALSRVKVMLLSFNTKHGLVYKLQNRHIMQNYDLLFQSTKTQRIYSPELEILWSAGLLTLSIIL